MAGTAPLIIPAIKRHTATVIVAHGLGDSGVGWIWLAENWRRRNKFEEVKFIFPNAPNIPITMVSKGILLKRNQADNESRTWAIECLAGMIL
jgi:predicted esterase